MSFNSLFKAEMIRQAKRATKGDLDDAIKKLNAQRKEIVALKRQVADLTKAVKKIGGQAPAKVKPVEAIDSDQKLRFRADGFASLRRKLGVTQSQMAQLLGVSTLTVLKWEKGTTRPRASQLATIAAVRQMGKREALQKLG